ncbi:histone-arginine methyltransferase CARMER-like [Hylaeus volcanicus]|uniref:histone-arginine methyltransferase CARMER-like n=1 Tax=Hylaeus volcanicus TaxID=313075 RepID=UPI0023B87B57|nr:histone-arginine methyltransferase CARMER-like [Hylaeus volcanicus]
MSLENLSQPLKEYNNIIDPQQLKEQDTQECTPSITISPLDGCDYSLFPLLKKKHQGTYKFHESSPGAAPSLMLYDQSPPIGCAIWSSLINQFQVISINTTTILLVTSTCDSGDNCKSAWQQHENINTVQNIPSINTMSKDFVELSTSYTASSNCPSAVVINFISDESRQKFQSQYNKALTFSSATRSHLDASDPSTVTSYFHYYGKMSNQMNMLQDSVRTKMYYNAILLNSKCFVTKRVMDVGGGSGILSLFSAQAGASSVYIVEASSSALVASALVEANTKWGSYMKVINSTVEKLDLVKDLDGEKVDILVSEPIGTFIFNERMIESYLFARDMFLKPGGTMYPNRCRLFLAPFCDPVLYNDISNRPNFWSDQNFYGVDLRSVYQKAADELFRQPIVDYIDPNNLITTEWHCEVYDFQTLSRDSLSDMTIEYRFPIQFPCLIHGIAGWFDVHFDEGEHSVEFSTSPLSPPTHWYQIRFLFRIPIAVNPGQVVCGVLRMNANPQQSYYITAEAMIEGTNTYTSTTVIDLKDPDYRYYSSPHSLYIPTIRQQPQKNHVGEKDASYKANKETFNDNESIACTN